MADAPSIRFHYIKSNAFRVIHADGVFGGPSPGSTRQLNVSFFSERAAIPTMVEHSLTDLGDGIMQMGNVVATEGKQGVVREVEAGVVMSLAMAKKLHAWLDEKIRAMEAQPDLDGMKVTPDAT